MTETSEAYTYTKEQKIVAAVWVHEKSRNNQTWKDIERNFRARFDAVPPSRATLSSWEKKLFSTGNREKTGRPMARLMHVPYVKESLKENPNLSLRERAQALGIPKTTLQFILKEDLHLEFHL